MFYCSYCDFQNKSWAAHIKHQRYHVDFTEHKVKNCGYLRCKKFFNSESLLRLHLSRTHGIKIHIDYEKNYCDLHDPFGAYTCCASGCEEQFELYCSYMKHVEDHLLKGVAVKCPFIDCKKTLNSVTQMRAHRTRRHRQKKKNDFGTYDIDSILSDLISSEKIEDHQTLYEKNLRTFFLALESKCRIPENTINFIVQSLKTLHYEEKDIQLAKIHEILTDQTSLQENDINLILKIVSYSNPFEDAISKLDSTYLRKCLKLSHPLFVKPVKIDIGRTRTGAQKFFWYVPIMETIRAIWNTEDPEQKKNI